MTGHGDAAQPPAAQPDAAPGPVRAGKLRYEEDILDGIEACPDALAGLYRGENRGKRLIRL